MSKEVLKTRISRRQNGRCAVSAEELAKETRLYDTDRIEPKAKGGTYTDKNTRVLEPVTHMKRHFNYRERSPEMTKLKVLIDGREQIRKLNNSLNNRLLADKRKTDHLDDETKAWITEQAKITKKQDQFEQRRIAKHLKTLNIPIVNTALKIRGIGPLTMAYVIVYIDITKAQYASSLWKYVGYDKSSHERYTKGESGGGNKTLRTALFTLGDSMVKHRAVYRDVYDNEKRKLENSMLVTKSRTTQGKLIECMWKDAKPCHRHGAALRKMLKHFLADLWFVWRTIEGLPTAKLYVEEKMGHTGIIRPEERGWKF